jgi:hypothetical protein
MTIRSVTSEQNSAYGSADPISALRGGWCILIDDGQSSANDGGRASPRSFMASEIQKPNSRIYPPSWEEVAELRVFKTTPDEWTRLIAWRADMRRKGWKLLRVNTEEHEMVAVFGKTRPELTGA